MSCSCQSDIKYHIELMNVIKDNDETYSFDFKSEVAFEWKEGDSSKVTLNPLIPGKKFSFATLPDENLIRFTTRIRPERSKYKDAMMALQVGQKVEISKPDGHFNLRRQDKPVILVSNGVGIAAARSLIKAFEKDKFGVPKLIQINIDRHGAIYEDEMDLLMRDHEDFVSYYENDRDDFYRRLDYLVQAHMTESDPDIYLVGSNNFVLDLMTHLKALGIDDESIITEDHILGEGCGCSSEEGCGCGGNIVLETYEDNFSLPVVN